MKIRLDKIGAEPFRWQEAVTVPASTLGRVELLELGDISCSGEIWIESPGFRLAAELSYEQTVACSRCLSPIVQTVESSVRLMVLVGEQAPAEGEVELTEEDLEVLQLTEEILDTEPVIIEQLQLNVPMKALCKEDCKGLCPLCGVNRNQDACGCEDSPVDPRWEVLRGLKE